MQVMTKQFLRNYDHHLDLSRLVTFAQLRFKSQITKARQKKTKTDPEVSGN